MHLSDESKPERSRSRGALIFFRDIALIILAALVISFLIKTFFIRSFYIPSGSMEETLHIDDRVIVSLLTPGLTPLKRGDVVVFTDPSDWLGGDEAVPVKSSPLNEALAFVGLAAPTDSNHLIKRVIGLPGDHIACCGTSGKLSVNGVAIDEPYINVTKGQNSDPFTFDVTVPKGDIWVMGDNRYHSGDSAYHEDKHDFSPFVPISDVTGRAMVISWPVSRWTYLDDYPKVFARVPKP